MNCRAVLWLVGAMARPFLKLPFGGKRLSLVIVLDNSPSMARVRDGKTLFEAGRDHARKIIAALGPHDRAEVVLTCPGLDPLYTADAAALLRDLESRAGRPTALLVQGRTAAQKALAKLDSNRCVDSLFGLGDALIELLEPLRT